MIKNNKGFVLTEVMILSTVVIGLLVFIFIQFKNINRSYQYSFKYDTVQDMYLANNIVNYINDSDFNNLVSFLSSSSNNYIDITGCDVSYFTVASYCESLFEKTNVEKVIFTYEDTSMINTSNFDESMKLYINSIATMGKNDDYRIIVKFNDGTFTSMRFNKSSSI